MKNLILACSFLLTNLLVADENYRYFINLNKVVNDKIAIQLVPPTLVQEEIEFSFPAMVPGTYEVYNFGRFISINRSKFIFGDCLKIIMSGFISFEYS